MRPQHTPHLLDSFPVYSAGFIDAKNLVLGGGGGSSRTGVLNKLRVYSVADDREITLVDELELARGEDSPMSIATNPEARCYVFAPQATHQHIHRLAHSLVASTALRSSWPRAKTKTVASMGLKSKSTRPLSAVCVSFLRFAPRLALSGTHGTLTSGDLDDYQRVTVLSPNGDMLAVGGTNSLQLLSYPSLAPIALPIKSDTEIYDAAFSQTTLVVVTTASLLVYALPSTASKGSPAKSKKKGKEKSCRGSRPGASSNHQGSRGHFQAVGQRFSCGSVSESLFIRSQRTNWYRFHPGNSDVLYTVSNTIPGRSKSRKPASRQAYVCVWNTSSWKADKVKKVADKSITCFVASPDGKYLAFGDSGCRIGMLDATSLSPVATILTAHEFPSTTLTFNPTSTLLVSGSADKVVRVVSVPAHVPKSSWTLILLILLTIIIALLAFAAQQYA
ncbi:WD-REPEATS-REGION domain-containing protein [Mycena chlorophos]|uniref:WD-REPEATS-REGION domain-containing protein n=1 Tax=Mycena chlorophos TaxID=658473 RepID=A0A8H6WIM8_MYCCL|nr:WD-REPEATS-REGION domain-containing protein [Mycena chlorophos]